MIDFSGAPQPKGEGGQAPAPELKIDPVEKLLGRMLEFDLVPNEIRQDGKLHRFDVDGRGNKAGWYVYFHGDLCGAAFGNWATGMKENWCSKDRRTMTYEERVEIDRIIDLANKARKAEKARLEAAAYKKAVVLFNDALPLVGNGNEYLKKKGVQAHGVRVSKSGDLLVPMIDENRHIWNVETIPKDGGAKKGLFGGRRNGVFFEIPGQPGNNTLYLCEGYSTGATIHEQTGATVICSFNAGNLPHVAKVIKKLYPSHNPVVAADNDQFSKGINAGVDYGAKAAKELDAPMAYPSFTQEQIETWRHVNGNYEKGPTDFNDLAVFNATEVVVQLGQADKKTMLPPLTAANTSLKNWLISRPPEREVILTLFGKPLMTKDLVGVLAATGGTGKTFFLLALAYALAAGKSFGPIAAVRPLKVLVICGEDDEAEVGRRFWDISGGDIPDGLHAASVYGEVGPLMQIENGHPVRAAGFDWLEATLKNHPDIDLLIFDPKSRFYGLDENNNDHATAWIGCLEYLCKRYVPNVLFATHTSQDGGDTVSQKMNRGASAIVDGCRWQAGLAQIDANTANEYQITNPRDYVVFDTPKSNYSARQTSPIFFKRTETGALEYVKLERPGQTDEIKHFLEGLANETRGFTNPQLQKGPIGQPMFDYMRGEFPDFRRVIDFKQLVNTCLADGSLKAVSAGSGSGIKDVLQVVER